MKRKESKYAIICNPEYGPLFGSGYRCDIYIANDCTRENSCWINSPSNFKYKCHPKYKSSLYVNTAGPDERNDFSVSDYEVYTYN